MGIYQILDVDEPRFQARGMAFPGGLEVVSVPPGPRLSLQSLDSATRTFTVGDDIRARVVRVGGDAAL